MPTMAEVHNLPQGTRALRPVGGRHQLPETAEIGDMCWVITAQKMAVWNGQRWLWIEDESFEHRNECPMVRAATSPIGIECDCELRRDVCPECDRCTCFDVHPFAPAQPFPYNMNAKRILRFRGQDGDAASTADDPQAAEREVSADQQVGQEPG